MKYHTTPFRVEFETNSIETTWKECVLSHAQSTAEKGSEPIMLAMSGGIDSEVIARAFKILNIPFRALTILHKHGTNRHDILWADEYCRQHNIEQIHVELDMPDFFNQGIESYIEKGYQAVNVYRYFQLWVMDYAKSLGSRAIMGSGEQVYVVHNGQVCVPYTEELLVPQSWTTHNQPSAEPLFYLTDNLTSSWLNINSIKTATQNFNLFPKTNPHFTSPFKSGTYKIDAIHQEWPDMIRRPAYSGYENIHRIRLEKQSQLKDRFGDRQIQYIPVSQLYKQFNLTV